MRPKFHHFLDFQPSELKRPYTSKAAEKIKGSNGHSRASVCVYVCVCVRARGSGRERASSQRSIRSGRSFAASFQVLIAAHASREQDQRLTTQTNHRAPSSNQMQTACKRRRAVAWRCKHKKSSRTKEKKGRRKTALMPAKLSRTSRRVPWALKCRFSLKDTNVSTMLLTCKGKKDRQLDCSLTCQRHPRYRLRGHHPRTH